MPCSSYLANHYWHKQLRLSVACFEYKKEGPSHTERKCRYNWVELAQCWFSELAISNAKI